MSREVDIASRRARRSAISIYASAINDGHDITVRARLAPA